MLFFYSIQDMKSAFRNIYELTKWYDNWKLKSIFIHHATSPAKKPIGEVNTKNLDLMQEIFFF